MGATFHSWGASASLAGDGTLSPSYPSGIQAGDLLVLVITSDNATQIFDPGVDWNWEVGTLTSASAEKVNYYTTIATGSETGTLGISVTGGGGGGDFAVAQIGRFTKGVYEQFEIGSTTAHTLQGRDTNANTTWSISSSSSDAARFPAPIFLSGDILVGAIAVNSGTSRNWTNESLSITGSTFGSISNVSETNISSNYTHRVYTSAVTSGPSSGSTISHTATLSSGTGMTGNEIFLLVRAVNRAGVFFQGDRDLAAGCWVGAVSGMTVDLTCNTGDLLIGLCAFKEGAVDSVATPSGWTNGGTFSGGTGTIGLDTGRTAIKVVYKVADGSETSVDFAGSGTSAMLGTVIVIQGLGSATWDLHIDGGSDTSTSTSWSTTLEASGGELATGDLMFVLNTQQTDLLSGVWSESFTATGLSTQLLFKNATGVQGIDDMAVRLAALEVTGGPSSSDLTHSATASDSVNGAGLLVRVRRGIAIAGGDDDLFVEEDHPPTFSTSITSSDTVAGAEDDLASGVVENEDVTFTDGSAVSVEKTDTESLLLTDEMASPVETDDINIVFNNSEDSPGFNISITTGVLLHEARMVRRDPSGLYPDQTVRGLDGVDITAGETEIPDYEAPINTPLEYWLTYEIVGEEFTIGPILPEPLPYIPTQEDPLYGACDFIKSVESPALSRRVLVTEFSEIQRKGNILGTYHVLGRRNPVVVADVLGGYEGSMSIVVLSTNKGASKYRNIDTLIDQGDTLLFQSNNEESSTFLDFYFKITGVTRKRLTTVDRMSDPSDPGSVSDLFVEYTFTFVEVDRPSSLGEAPSLFTWDTYYHQEFADWASWQEVNDFRTSWLDVLRKAGEPKVAST